jgi:hypothetical protein
VRGLLCRCRPESCPGGERGPDQAKRFSENVMSGRLKQLARIGFAWSRAAMVAIASLLLRRFPVAPNVENLLSVPLPQGRDHGDGRLQKRFPPLSTAQRKFARAAALASGAAKVVERHRGRAPHGVCGAGSEHRPGENTELVASKAKFEVEMFASDLNYGEARAQLKPVMRQR